MFGETIGKRRGFCRRLKEESRICCIRFRICLHRRDEVMWTHMHKLTLQRNDTQILGHPFNYVTVFFSLKCIFLSLYLSITCDVFLRGVSSDVIKSDTSYHFSFFRLQLCHVRVFLQAFGGHGR